MQHEFPRDHGVDLPGSGTNRNFYLPRLPREYYQGDAVVHWTMAIAGRDTGWLDEPFHSRFREVMLHAAAREGLLCPTYCLMPDHIHLVWMGLRRHSDQRNGKNFFESMSAYTCAHTASNTRRMMKERLRGAFAKVCFYVVDNARRAELVKNAKDWPFAGAIVSGYPELHPLAENFWPSFWKVYLRARLPDAGDIRRPPIC
jgi:putative transposase